MLLLERSKAVKEIKIKIRAIYNMQYRTNPERDVQRRKVPPNQQICVLKKLPISMRI